jgi:hypothetical protein
VLAPDTSTALEIRPATDADWPAISLLDATSFGRFGRPESLAAWGVADAEQHRPRARRTPTGAGADIHTDLDMLGSLYLGARRASSFAAANRVHCNDSRMVKRVDAAFASDVPAELGFGF